MAGRNSNGNVTLSPAGARALDGDRPQQQQQQQQYAQGDRHINGVALSMRKWPAPIQRLLNFLFYSLLEPDDDEVTYLRKLAISTMPVFGLIMLLLVIVGFIQTPSPKLGEGIEAGAHTTTTINLFASWLVVKYHPHHSEIVFSANLFINIAVNLVHSFAQVTHNPGVASAILACFGFTFGLRWRGRMALLSVVVQVIAGYNQSAMKSPVTGGAQCGRDTEPVLIPGANDSPSMSDFLGREVGQILNFSILWLLLELHARQTAKMRASAVATVTLASDMSAALALYDTARADGLLQEARATRREIATGAAADVDRHSNPGEGLRTGVVDGSMLDHFELIVENLTRYRPHLPNWLLYDSGDQTAAATMDDLDAVEVSGGALGGNTTSSGSSTPNSSALGVSRLRGGLQVHISTSTEPCKHRVVLADIWFRVPPPSELRESGVARTAADVVSTMSSAANSFVDRLHQIAAHTGAATHGFVGDVVHVSWNATCRAAQPEARAARLFARLREDSGHPLVKTWGAAAYGDARVHLAGLAAQKALLITPSFTQTWGVAQQLAASFKTFVVDAGVCAGARHAVHLRGVAAVEVDVGASGRRSPSLAAAHPDHGFQRRPDQSLGESGAQPALAASSLSEEAIRMDGMYSLTAGDSLNVAPSLNVSQQDGSPSAGGGPAAGGAGGGAGGPRGNASAGAAPLVPQLPAVLSISSTTDPNAHPFARGRGAHAAPFSTPNNAAASSGSPSARHRSAVAPFFEVMLERRVSQDEFLYVVDTAAADADSPEYVAWRHTCVAVQLAAAGQASEARAAAHRALGLAGTRLLDTPFMTFAEALAGDVPAPTSGTSAESTTTPEEAPVDDAGTGNADLMP